MLPGCYYLNMLNNPKFGGSQKLKICIGIPPLDNPMTILPQKNGKNSLQLWSCKVWYPWSHLLDPHLIHQRIWASHTLMERSRIAFYGYANLWSPDQTKLIYLMSFQKYLMPHLNVTSISLKTSGLHFLAIF